MECQSSMSKVYYFISEMPYLEIIKGFNQVIDLLSSSSGTLIKAKLWLEKFAYSFVVSSGICSNNPERKHIGGAPLRMSSVQKDRKSTCYRYPFLLV